MFFLPYLIYCGIIKFYFVTMRDKYSTAFELGIPSVFVIASPFQALCSIATIKQLKITEYLIVALMPSDDIRSSQLRSFLEKEGVLFTAITQFNWFIWLYYKQRAYFHKNNKYKRLFIGDVRSVVLHIIGFSYVSDDSEIVFLDDGNITVSVLNDEITEPMNRINIRRINMISRIRRFGKRCNFLTIYSDITNSKYVVKQLDLSQVISTKSRDTVNKKNVYIIGTYLLRYCEPLGIPTEKFISVLDNLFYNIIESNPSEHVVYIPHGRDDSEYARMLCERYGCEFHRPEIMVELELLNQDCYPLAIYGFTSSALYNLKKLFPDSSVYNILICFDENNVFYREYKALSSYYIQNGILLQEEKIDVK